MEKEILTKTQVCALLCISRASLDNMIRRGVIPKGFRQQGRKEKLWYKNTIELLSNNNENWKKVMEYEDLYEVSNLGRIRNCKSGKLVMQSVTISGYKRATLYKNGKPKTKLVHRLVAEAFLPNPSNYTIVNHIDENKLNNVVTNLEWCTQSQNIMHHYKGNIAKSPTKYVVLKIAQDGTTISKYSNILGAARANNIEYKELKKVLTSSRILNGFIWIKLALS